MNIYEQQYCTIDYLDLEPNCKWAVRFTEPSVNSFIHVRFAFLHEAEGYVVDRHRLIKHTEAAKRAAHDYNSDFRRWYL